MTVKINELHCTVEFKLKKVPTKAFPSRRQAERDQLVANNEGSINFRVSLIKKVWRIFKSPSSRLRRTPPFSF